RMQYFCSTVSNARRQKGEDSIYRHISHRGSFFTLPQQDSEPPMEDASSAPGRCIEADWCITLRSRLLSRTATSSDRTVCRYSKWRSVTSINTSSFGNLESDADCLNRATREI